MIAVVLSTRKSGVSFNKKPYSMQLHFNFFQSTVAYTGGFTARGSNKKQKTKNAAEQQKRPTGPRQYKLV